MDIIVETLHLSWAVATKKIYQKYNPITANELIELLEEEEERELNPLCIDLEQKRMCAYTPVHLHMFAK